MSRYWRDGRLLSGPVLSERLDPPLALALLRARHRLASPLRSENARRMRLVYEACVRARQQSAAV